MKKNYKTIGVFLNVIIIYWLKNENILLVFLLISKLNSFFAENSKLPILGYPLLDGRQSAP
ncbi:hypothetical protein, partial [Phocaeicola coprocola]|uniref:hypothetical protein n=1 Tax=Phocaeicola coprocola TaxID=310298 RepID=UPI00266F35C3